MNVIGFDDGPFPREHRGNVLLVGTVCSGTRLDGVVSGRIRRDGADSTREMVRMVRASQFREHLQAVLLQGIAVGGFNVVDVQGLREELGIPVLVVVRKKPDLASVHRALFADTVKGVPRVSGARRKWKLIEQAGALEALEISHRARRRITGLDAGKFPRLWMQRAGISVEDARKAILATTLHGNIPEPLRLAHLIAGGIVDGSSRGRA